MISISYRRIRRCCDNWSETFKADFQCVDNNSNPLEIGLSFFWNQLHFSPTPNSLDMEFSSLHWSKISSFTFYVSLRVIGRNHHPSHSHFNFFLFNNLKHKLATLWKFMWIRIFLVPEKIKPFVLYWNLGTLVFVSEGRSFWETSNGHAYFILPNRGLYTVAEDECTEALDGAYPAVFEDSEEWEDTKVGL